MGSWGGLYDGGHGVACSSAAKGEASSKVEALWLKSPYHASSLNRPSWRSSLCWGLWSCSSWTRWRTSSVASSIFLLKISQSRHLLLLPLYLLMDYLHIPDLLVQLLVLECWTGGFPLMASSLSKRKSFLVWVQRLQCSGSWCWSLLWRHDEGQCLPKVVEKGSPEVGANVGDLFSNAMS
jgi:hypothetical protein